MKAKELFASICEGIDMKREPTCDTIKAGDPEKEIHKVAFTMFPTVKTFKEVTAWGADLLIVHEPTYYDHMDRKNLEIKPSLVKKEILDESGLTVYRFHDFAHDRKPDLIFEGEIKALGLSGKLVESCAFGINVFELDEAITPKALALLMEERYGLAHIRFAGNGDAPIRKLLCSFGATDANVIMAKAEEANEVIVLCGETTEWKMAEYFRDLSEIGEKKALLVLGHQGSEREGMRLLADLVKEKFPALETKYFENGEPYQYTH